MTSLFTLLQGLIFVKKFQARTEAARPEGPRAGVGGWNSWVGAVSPSPSARASGGAVSFRSGSVADPQPKSNLMHFSLNISHLVATITIIFVINNIYTF